MAETPVSMPRQISNIRESDSSGGPGHSTNYLGHTVTESDNHVAREYGNSVLKNLASRTSLEKLDRVQNAARRLILGALRSTPIAILGLASGCEPLSLGRSEQTDSAHKRYLRTDQGTPFSLMTEEFASHHRRVKKASVLSVSTTLRQSTTYPPIGQRYTSQQEPPKRRQPFLISVGTSDQRAEKKKRATSLFELCPWKLLPTTTESIQWHTRAALQLGAR
ncbi:hypothetical protein PoB_001365700 [Plakobranchus ocellatus]|uniref:Uncharacterized protein n=1 Tax=Plakobranchus ocellatus TaxID=259542 RepID=A0AAV3YW05_9GAST|nr:hypothetical protein PoB_001365700 [Plakobranchus ocellatus]